MEWEDLTENNLLQLPKAEPEQLETAKAQIELVNPEQIIIFEPEQLKAELELLKAAEPGIELVDLEQLIIFEPDN